MTLVRGAVRYGNPSATGTNGRGSGSKAERNRIRIASTRFSGTGIDSDPHERIETGVDGAEAGGK
jgi:hypothetical protein